MYKIVIFIILLVNSSFVFASDTKTVKKFYTEAVDIKQQYQQQYYELLKNNFPKYSDVTNTDYELQMILIRIKDIRFNNLLKNKPASFDLAKGYRGLMNFNWNAGNDKYLASIDPEYESLLTKKLELVEKAKNLSERRKLLRSEIAATPVKQDLKNLINNSKKLIDELNNKIMNYKQGDQ